MYIKVESNNEIVVKSDADVNSINNGDYIINYGKQSEPYEIEAYSKGENSTSESMKFDLKVRELFVPSNQFPKS